MHCVGFFPARRLGGDFVLRMTIFLSCFFYCHPEGNTRRIPWLLALCSYYCCGWDSSDFVLRMTFCFVLFFYCHPEGNTRRIPRLLALCSYYCCGWDSSLPAVGGPARRLSGAPLRMTKTVQNDINKMFEIMEGRRNGRRKNSKRIFPPPSIFQFLSK